MRAIAASRKIAKSHPEKTITNGTAPTGVRQKIVNNRACKSRSHTTSSLYAAPSSSLSTSVLPEAKDPLIPKSSSMIPGQGGNSIQGVSETNGKEGDNLDHATKVPSSRTSEKHVTSIDVSNASPSLNKFNGPLKKNVKDNMKRTMSNLSHTPSSVATTNAWGGSKVGSKTGGRKTVAEKRYYAKAIILMVVGGFIFAIGITLAGLYFSGDVLILMAGPICLSVGLLLLVCGIVWLPIIKTKLKRQQQIMSRTFSL